MLSGLMVLRTRFLTPKGIFRIVLFSFIGFLLAFAGAASASSSRQVIITEDTEKIPIGLYTEYFEDEKAELTIKEVLNPEYADRFTQYEKDQLNFGISTSAFWTRTEIVNTTDNAQKLFLESAVAWVDFVNFYLVGRDGEISIQRNGDIAPFNVRQYPSPNFVFPFEIEPGGKLTFYLRVKSVDAMIVPFTIWKGQAFNIYNKNMGSYYGVFFGIIGIFFIYNLFVFFATREASYFYYVLFLLSIFMMTFTYNGFTSAYLCPGCTEFASRLNIAFIAISQFFGVMFAKSFLQTKTTMPLIDKMFNFLLVLVVIVVVAITPLFPFTGISLAGMASLVSTQIYSPLLFISGVIALRDGNRSAKYYLIGWSASITGVMLAGGTALGLVEYSFVTFRSMEIGFLVDIVLLSFALVDKVNILREEKDTAQSAYREILERDRDMLEKEVRERTVELVAAKEKAEEATRIKDKFVSLVSHDLRSPISTILLLTEMLNRKPDKDKRESLTEKIINTSNGLITMIDALLDVSRFKTGKIVPKKMRVSLFSLVQQKIIRMSHLADQKGVELINETPENLTVFVDSTMIGEVLVNLISNSIKFCSKGDRVIIYAPEAEKGVLAVKDNGPGIHEKLLPNIFNYEVKTSTPGSSGEKGTGLGLPLCLDILKGHGGNLSVESTTSEGTVFFLELPKQRPLLLIVDDQEVHRSMMKQCILEKMEVDFIEADNGREAVELLKNSTPELIITDIMMPEMDGVELLRFLKKDTRFASISTIITTSETPSSSFDGSSEDMDTRTRLFEMGANDLVIKPIVPNDFVPRVLRFLSAETAGRVA